MLTQFFVVIKRAGWGLFSLWVLSNYTTQVLTHLIEQSISSFEPSASSVWIYVGALAFISILVPIISSCLIVATQISAPIMQSVFQYGPSLCKETLRASGKSMLWLFLFILPGFIRFLQFSFVGFIVMLDPEYGRGHKDALKESTGAVNRRFFRVLVILTLFALFVPFFLTLLGDWAIFHQHPTAAVGLSGIDTILNIICTLLLLHQWRESLPRRKDHIIASN